MVMFSHVPTTYISSSPYALFITIDLPQKFQFHTFLKDDKLRVLTRRLSGYQTRLCIIFKSKTKLLGPSHTGDFLPLYVFHVLVLVAAQGYLTWPKCHQG